MPCTSRIIRFLTLVCLASMGIALASRAARAADLAPEQIKFFEERIRPLLVERCYECHANQKHQGDVRLDLRDAVLAHLIVPGQPDQSRLIQVLRCDPNDTQMPPKGKLPQEQIDLVTEWVKQGAPWPADHPAGAQAAAGFPRLAGGEIDFDATAHTHWAYSPLTRPLPPKIDSSDRPLSPIDHFIVAQLQAAGLSLSPQADRATE